MAQIAIFASNKMSNTNSTILTTAKQVGLFFRGLSSSLRMYPEFIIPGVQKGGTTSLYAYLDQHPSLKLSRPKEVHFFDDNYEHGIGYYKRYFPFKFRGLKTGESSPYYIFHPHVAKRIKNHLPKVKIIIVLRNPILRAYSHYQMQRRQNIESLESFELAIAAEKDRLHGEREKMLADEFYYSENYRNFSYVARGMYYHQVKSWLANFGTENVHFIKSENLLANPEVELFKVYDFLKLERIVPKNLSKKHAHPYPTIEKDTFNSLRKMFLADQEKLIDLIGEEFSWF